MYSLAIATYAAYLANYKNKEALLQKLDSYAKVQGKIGNFVLTIIDVHILIVCNIHQAIENGGKKYNWTYQLIRGADRHP